LNGCSPGSAPPGVPLSISTYRPRPRAGHRHPEAGGMTRTGSCFAMIAPPVCQPGRCGHCRGRPAYDHAQLTAVSLRRTSPTRSCRP
jgi:hypothetical protein